MKCKIYITFIIQLVTINVNNILHFPASPLASMNDDSDDRIERVQAYKRELKAQNTAV